MKKTWNFKATVLSLLLIVSLFHSCKKETFSVNKLDTASYRENGISYNQEKDIFELNTFAETESYIENIKTEEEDLVKLRDAYSQLGVDTTAEYFPNLTDHPICLLHDQSFDFVSKRKAEESVINATLDSGEDIFSIVSNPYWKSLLNQNGSVKIGDRIYRFFDNKGIAIILNSDWAKYDVIKNQAFEEIEDDFNVLVTSRKSASWNDCFTLDANENVTSEKAIHVQRFVYEPLNNGNFVLHNYSIIESSNSVNTFKWLYTDGTSSFGKEPNRTFAPSEELSVLIDTGNGNPFEVSVPQVTVTLS